MSKPTETLEPKTQVELPDDFRDLDPGHDPNVLLSQPNQPAPKRKNKGGSGTHKDPNCQCVCCISRRRKAQTLPVPTGNGGLPVESLPRDETGTVLEADYPDLESKPKNTPRNKLHRARIAAWIKMRYDEPGISNKEIAERMGINPKYLSTLIWRASKDGWLTFDDPMNVIEYKLIPKVAENLEYYLNKRDKIVTLETAKGTIFKQYQESKGISDAPQTVLALKIEGGIPQNEVKAVLGQIVGKPRKFNDD